MNLEETINDEIKKAMLARNNARLEALRAVKSAILLLKTGEGLSPDSGMKTLQKLVKQRRETAVIYRDQNRPELAEAEEFQANVIEEFLPKGLSPEELEAGLKEILAEMDNPPASMFGKVMGEASKRFAGRADGKQISVLLKELMK